MLKDVTSGVKRWLARFLREGIDILESSAQADPPSKAAGAHYRILRDHVAHHLSLLDLFETRQTWAFNFALLLYAGAYAVLGPILQQIPATTTIHNLADVPPVAVYSILIAYSIILPSLVLPVCFLYADVSVFCAALNTANLDCLREAYEDLGLRVPQNLDPGALAFKWLSSPRVGIHIDWMANHRTLVFFVAPAAGALASGIYLLAACDLHLPLPRKLTAVAGLVASITAFRLTYVASATTWKARKEANDLRVKQTAPGP